MFTGIKGQFKRLLGTGQDSNIPAFIDVKLKNNTHCSVHLLEYNVQKGERLSLRKTDITQWTELATTCLFSSEFY
jgi:hypothetical protein